MAEPITRLNSYQKRSPATTFLRDTFFGNVVTSPTETVEMDFYKNGQVVAPFVADGVSSINMKRDEFKTKTYKPPLITPSRILDPKVINNVIVGENPYSPMTAEERAENIIRRDYEELSDSIARAEEKMVAEILQTGIITATGYIDDSLNKSVINKIDFDFENRISISAAQKWDNGGDPNITIDITADLIRSAGYDPQAMILGSNAVNAMLKNEKFIKVNFDSSRANLGYLDPKVYPMSGGGFTLLGKLTTTDTFVYSYNAKYFDVLTNKLEPYIDPDNMIMCPYGIGEMLYGAVTLIDEDIKDYITYETTRASQIITSVKNSTKELVLKSRPLPKPNDVSSWAVAKVTGSVN